jgi:hypothetical protein
MGQQISGCPLRLAVRNYRHWQIEINRRSLNFRGGRIWVHYGNLQKITKSTTHYSSLKIVSDEAGPKSPC